MTTASGYRHIVSTRGIRGGNPRIEGTRVAVHDIVAYFLMGNSVDDIQARFPDISRAQIFESMAYYEDHRSDIEKLVFGQISEHAQ